jgi:hypothetical protein
MANSFQLGWRNYVLYRPDAVVAAASGTVTVGALSALQDMRLSKRVTVTAVSDGSGMATVQLTWTLPSGSAPVDLLGLLNYSVSAPDAAYAIVSLTATGSSGSFTVNADWTRPSADFPLHAWALATTRVIATSVTVEVVAAFGGPGEVLTVTAGGLWAGPVWSPSDGLDASWSQEIVDPGTVSRSVGGQGYPRPRQRYRRWRGKVVHVGIIDAFGDPASASYLDIQQLLYRVGNTQPIALFPRTKDVSGAISTHLIHRLGMYGHFTKTGRIEHLGGDFYQWTEAEVDELL